MSLQTHPNRFFSKFCYVLQLFLTFGLLMFFMVENGGPNVFPSFTLGKAVASYYPHGIPTSGQCELFGEKINCASLNNNICLKNNNCFKSSDLVVAKALEQQPAGIVYQNKTTFGVLVSSVLFIIMYLILFATWIIMYFNEFQCIRISRWIPQQIKQFFTGNYWKTELNFHKVYIFFSTLVFLTSVTGLVWFSADWNQDYYITSNRNIDSSYFGGYSNCTDNLFINMAKTNTPNYTPKETHCYENNNNRLCCLENIVKLNNDALQLMPILKHYRTQFEVAWSIGLFFGSLITYFFQWLTVYWGYQISKIRDKFMHIDFFDTEYYNHW